MIGHAASVEDHSEGDEKDAQRKDVETVLWLGYSAISACQLDGEHAADFSAVIATENSQDRCY